MSLETQVNIFIDRASALVPTLAANQAQTLQGHIDSVAAALNNDSVVGSMPGMLGPLRNDAQDCRGWQAGQGTGSAWANSQFYMWGGDWEYQLTQALRAAAGYLRSIGQPGEAEVADAVGDSAETATTLADDVIPDTPGEWWDSIPTWG